MNLFGFGQPLTLWIVLLRLLIAVIISAVIGIDREIKNRPAGMRTHVLVCVGATLIALIEQHAIFCVSQLGDPQINLSFGRITSAVVSGVGFLGAGTIVMSEHRITGLTTAASVWCVACIGLAVGSGMEIIAVIVGVLIMVVLRLMQRIVHVHTYKKLEIRFVHRVETLAFLNDYFTEIGVRVLDADFHAETDAKNDNIYTNLYTLVIPSGTSSAQIIARLSEHKNIRAVYTRNV